MPLTANDILKDRCYVTQAGQVRRVLGVQDGKIRYEARGSQSLPAGKPWNPAVTVLADKFAADILKEVRCDYDPAYDPEKQK